jgi:hypothetical protein
VREEAFVSRPIGQLAETANEDLLVIGANKTKQELRTTLEAGSVLCVRESLHGADPQISTTNSRGARSTMRAARRHNRAFEAAPFQGPPQAPMVCAGAG